jgi:hypothetical protein
MPHYGPSSVPSVGIFWFLFAEGAVHLLTRGCPLPNAEPYGDCLTFAEGHYETWTAWQRRTAVHLPIEAVRGVISATEYESWPRGRIVYEMPATRFVIYADKQLLSVARLTLVRTAFGLPAGTTAASDAHYSGATRLPPDGGG